jgi:hypothetical protein
VVGELRRRVGRITLIGVRCGGMWWDCFMAVSFFLGAVPFMTGPRAKSLGTRTKSGNNAALLCDNNGVDCLWILNIRAVPRKLR